jgi:ParB family chromosome partitioning protein
VIAGARRVKACVMAGMAEIDVLVCERDDRANIMRAFAENMMRTGLGTVDQWRGIEALVGADWTEDAIAVALSLPMRTIKRVRLCAHLHPAILDQMAKGDEPRADELRLIAAAPPEEQAQAWKKHKPKKGETTLWHSFAAALRKDRMPASAAAFDDELAKAYGIVWQEDLFAPADEDSRYTTQVEEFLGAQYEWMTNHLPEKGVILEIGQYGEPKLPPKAERVYGKPGKGDILGHAIDQRSGKIIVTPFRMPEPKAKPGTAKAMGRNGAQAGGHAGTDDAGTVEPVSSRPALSQRGQALIGNIRTDALAEAFAAAEIDDTTLLGLLVMGFAAQNVSVQTASTSRSWYELRQETERAVTEGGVLTQDLAILRKTARSLLAQIYSCRENVSRSGVTARIAGQTIDATRYLPSMANEEFLSCLSKAALNGEATAHGVLPRSTARATRAAMAERFKGERYLYPAARFDLSAAEQQAHETALAQAAPSLPADEGMADDAGMDGNEVEASEDDAGDRDDEGDEPEIDAAEVPAPADAEA